MIQKHNTFIILVSLLLLLEAEGFCRTNNYPPSATSRTTTVHSNTKKIPFLHSLFALHAKKTSKRVSSGGGGFGAKSSSIKEPTTHDYALFPPLDPNVVATLIPSAATTTADMNEVYQRLDQIYGFPDFNYDSTKQNNDNPSPNSFQDLISLSPSIETDSSFTMLDRIPAFTNVQVLHMDPLVLSIPDFFTADECDRYVALSNQPNAHKSRSPTVGKDAVAKAQRTSTTWYHLFASVPELMAKASRLLGLADDHHRWEEPQTVRYRRNEKFTWHLDALGPAERETSGQRVATLLVYLTDLLSETDGGATQFRDLYDAQGNRLTVRPQKGAALLFFPAAGGIPDTPYDIRTLHCGQVVSETASHDKWIAQLWLRERSYAPTAPPGNRHAVDEIDNYCRSID